jgi:hypothetical protein
MVCDNLSFLGKHVVRRRHTVNAKREFPGLLTEIVAPLRAQCLAQNGTFLRYKAKQLTDEQADHAILTMYRNNVVGLHRIDRVVHQWDNPAHDWGGRTACRLSNAATFALAGRVAERPSITTDLHQLIDSVCEKVHASVP